MIRAVLDTNVLASGFVGFADSERAPTRLLQFWQGRRFEFVTSTHILTELVNTLASPYFRRRLTSEQIEAAGRLVQAEATIVTSSVLVSGVAAHPEDDRVLAAAVSAQADYLVTGDRKL